MAFKVARFEQTSNHHLKLRKQKQKQHRMKLRKKAAGGREVEEEIQKLRIESATVEQLAIKVNRPLTKSSTKVLF